MGHGVNGSLGFLALSDQLSRILMSATVDIMDKAHAIGDAVNMKLVCRMFNSIASTSYRMSAPIFGGSP